MKILKYFPILLFVFLLFSCETVTSSFNKIISINDPLQEINKMSDCDRCIADFNHCKENAMGSWAIFQFGVFFTAGTVAGSTIWLGPGSIITGVFTGISGTVFNGFEYITDRWECVNTYKYCKKQNNCAIN